jgi:CheY-like chemotaxis protein
MHGGTLAAASEGTDKGATFTLELPSAAAVSPDAVVLEPYVSVQQDAACRILLVEDHADTLRIMARLLRSSGYSVHTTGSVRGAIEAAEHEPFHLLISDIGLPDGSGIEIMNWLKPRYDTVGIALSGFGHDEDYRNSKAAGFTAHLVKPVDLRRLEETILEALVGQQQLMASAGNRSADPVSVVPKPN